ncbi:hypothetical protein D915_005156 [Fasciola hepatica]|uniref:Receptor ligand binding region domain-containing protein n=1 Tax=Fasciola hepatica TaxID=6192 RepID=A0A4E0RCS0_FASHE|nr:hypothetical protein D915_005156 [Fasciola hepatica]
MYMRSTFLNRKSPQQLTTLADWKASKICSCCVHSLSSISLPYWYPLCCHCDHSCLQMVNFYAMSFYFSIQFVAELLNFLSKTLNLSLPVNPPVLAPVNGPQTLNTFLLSWYPNGFTLPTSLPNLRLPDCDLTVPNGNGSTVHFITHSWLPPDSQFTSPLRRSDNPGPFCRFESHQTTKLTWAKLQTAVPLLHQLVSHMRLSQSEYDELLNSVHWVTGGSRMLATLDVCGVNPVTVVALEAIDFVNKDPTYFGSSEYSLTMIIRNLTCVQDVVLNDYFDLLMSSAGKRLIGVIAALCSDSIEPVVEVANFRRQLIISPTVESTRFGDVQKHRYFFRTIPSMSHASFDFVLNYPKILSARHSFTAYFVISCFLMLTNAPSLILIRFFRYSNWRRVALFRKDNHFFDPRVFQLNGIDVIADFEMKESQLNFALVKQGLEKMSEHNSRIFIVEYFARGTALVLCAAYRLGFYFDAGYVWFLNPWLSKDWWNSAEILPTQCTMSEMANITSWTFTLEHQVMRTVVYPYPRESLVTEPEVVNRVSRHVAEHSVADLPMDSDTQPMDSVDILEDHNYAVYTWESVIVLAKALVHLLRENPSAMSVFETVQVAEAYQRIVASTDIVYTSTPETFLPTREKSAHDGTSDLLGLSANDPAIQVSSRLRFNDQNERATDFWLLRQHRGPVTASVIRWAVIPPTTTLLNGSVHADLGHERDEVPAMIGEAVLEPINWGRHHGPPGDGSQTEEHCAFLLASQLFGVSCSTATTICVIGMIALLAFPLFTVFIIYYRRKLKEAERLIRKPYEDLCEELVDIDFQPGAGACIMSEHALASDGPASNNPPSSMALVEGMSNNHVSSGRGFHSTTGSLAGIGRSSLAYCSTDSFSESTVAAARLIASEGIQQSAGRRRHKTAEGSVGLVRGHFLRRGTTSSSSGGHTCHGSEASSDDRSHGDLNQAKSSAALFTLTPLLTHGSVGSQPSPTRPTEPSVYTAMRKLGNGARRSTKQIGSSVTTRRGESMASPRHLLLHKPGSMDDELMELNSEHSKAKNIRTSHDLPDLVKLSDSLMHRHPGGLNKNVTNGPVDTRISSIKEQTKQPNGVVSSTLSFPLKVLAEASQIRPIIKSAIKPKNCLSLTPPDTAAHVGRGSDGYPWVSSPQTSSRSVVDNASHLFRSVIRAIWRNNNQNKQTGRSPPGGTLRITRSSTSCRALGAQDLSCISQSNPDVKTSNVSTYCPPLLMPQCSFVNSRLTDNPDGSEPSRVSGCIPSLPATPAERSFFPQLHNNSLDNFSITDPVPPTLVHRSTHASLNSLSQHPVVSSPNREVAENSLTSVVYTKLSDQVSPVLPPTPCPTPPSTNSPEPRRKPSYIDASPSDPFYLV